MAVMNVNPTRMELTRLKKRLVTATRGHKLLKDKRDDLMKKFLEQVRQNKELRTRVEEKIMKVYSGFAAAGAVMSEAALEEALMLPREAVSLNVGEKNVMSVSVPVFEFKGGKGGTDITSYGFVTTSGELDDSAVALGQVLPDLLLLAQMEKSSQLLAEEIEKTRRRVNALEYVQIPSLQETIKSITQKLDENERSNLSRLLKIKDMMIARSRGEKA